MENFDTDEMKEIIINVINNEGLEYGILDYGITTFNPELLEAIAHFKEARDDIESIINEYAEDVGVELES